MRIRLLVLPLALLAALSACAPEAPSGEPSTSPSSTATEQVAATAPVPAGQFPFDCTTIAAPTAFDTLVPDGAIVHAPGDDPFAVATRVQEGRLYCSVYVESDRFLVSLAVSRDAALRLAADYGEPVYPTDWDGALGVPESSLRCDEAPNAYSCRALAVVGDYLVSGELHIDRTDRSLDDLRAVSEAVIGDVVAALVAEPVPPRWSPPAGAGPLRADCAAIAAAADLETAAGIPGLVVRDDTGVLEGAAPLPSEIASLGGLTTCSWTTPDGAIDPPWATAYVNVLSGGSWLWEAPPSEATMPLEAVEVPGAARAAYSCREPDVCTLVLQFGLDVVEISGYHAPRSDAGWLPRDVLLTIGTAIGDAF